MAGPSARLECSGDTRTFWECRIKGDTSIVTFGQVGAIPKEGVRKHKSAHDARMFFLKNMTKMQKNGYVRTSDLRKGIVEPTPKAKAKPKAKLRAKAKAMKVVKKVARKRNA